MPTAIEWEGREEVEGTITAGEEGWFVGEEGVNRRREGVGRVERGYRQGRRW